MVRPGEVTQVCHFHRHCCLSLFNGEVHVRHLKVGVFVYGLGVFLMEVKVQILITSKNKYFDSVCFLRSIENAS